MGCATDQRRERRGLELGGQRRRDRLQLERRIVAQNGLVQAPQVGPGLGADLVDERPARRPVRLERVGLSPAAIERQHQLAAQPLAQGMARDQILQLGDQLD